MKVSEEPCQCPDCLRFYREHDRLIREFPTLRQQQEVNWAALQSFRTLCGRVLEDLQKKLNSKSSDNRFKAITIAPLRISLPNCSSISGLTILDRDVKFIIPWAKALCKNGFFFIRRQHPKKKLLGLLFIQTEAQYGTFPKPAGS